MKMRYTVLIIVLALPAALQAGWTSETVRSAGDVGDGCSIAVDRWGRPHITYIDKTNGRVDYATFNGSSWDFNTVAEDVQVTGNTALALDAFDKPFVIFQDDKTDELMCGYLSGANWKTEKIDSGTNYGQYVSISAWPLGRRVSYTKPAGMDIGLEYAYRDAGGWETETVVSKGGGESNTVLVDENDYPNIVYYNSSTSSIKYAVRKNNEWSIDDIAEGVDCGAFVGPDNKIHVSFAKANNEGLNYAVSTSGGSWKIENVNAAKGAPAFTDICVNGAGNVFISYFNFDESDLRVVTKKGGSWNHEVVAAGGYVGRPHSIAPGPGGYPLIAYYEANNGDLKLARYVTDVELTTFTAQRHRAGVDIRWAVNGARNVAGYNLYRGAADGEREKVNAALVEGVSPFRYRDAQAPENVALRYWLEAVATTGTRRTFGPASVPPTAGARTFALYQNAPNPFAGTTTFAFELPEGADVKLVVYDVAGRKVADVAEGRFAAGRHEVHFANELAPGVYVYRLEAGPNAAAHKMVVID
jgi:hypothetical protein